MTTLCDPVTLPELLRESLRSGGSGRGLTFWSEASRCGKQALFTEARRDRWRDDPSTAPAIDVSKKYAFAVGGVYHKLHELWDEELLTDECLANVQRSEDESVNLGIHLFRGWKAHWSWGYWGESIGSEVQLPASDYVAGELTRRFGEVVNAKPDRIVYMNDHTIKRVRERCPAITEPGFYMVDFKTAGTHYDDLYYHEGNQAYWYPYVWNLENPDRAVKGFVYDIIVKPNPRAKDQTIALENFPTPVYVPLHSEKAVENVFDGLFQQGRDNIERARQKNLGNRSECIKIAFGKVEACPFLGRECHGH